MKTQDTLDASADTGRRGDGLAPTHVLEEATADAEAQAGSAGTGLADSMERISALEGELAGARSAHESAATEALELRSQLDMARQQAREATMKYRQARLAAAPDVPPDMVPESEDLLEIDRGLENAHRLVGLVRESVQQELQATARLARVPAGAPARRAPDLSSLSASEKIRVGLERLSEAGAQ